MKKLYFFLVALLVGISAYAAGAPETLYLCYDRGSGWNSQAFTKSGNTFTYEIEVSKDNWWFNITNYKANGWDFSNKNNQVYFNGGIGTADGNNRVLTTDVNYQLYLYGTFDDVGCYKMAGKKTYVLTVTFEANNNNPKLKITEKGAPEVPEVITYAVNGSFTNNWSMASMTNTSGDIWTYSCTLNDNYGEFGIVKLNNGEQESWYSAPKNTDRITDTTTLTLTSSDNDNVKIGAGEWDFSYNAATKALTLTKKGNTEVVEVKSYAIHGSWTSNDWVTKNLTEGADGKWTISDVEITNDGANFGVRYLINGNAAEWYRVAKEQGKVESTTTLDLVKEATADSHNIAIATGTWSFSLDPATMKLTCTKAGSTTPDPDPTTTYTVKFNNGKTAWDNVYAYIYRNGNSDGTENHAWPGEAMTAGADGIYTYSFDSTWEPLYVIFNNGDKAQLAKEDFENGKTYGQAADAEDVISYELRGDFTTAGDWNDVKFTEANGLLVKNDFVVANDNANFGVKMLTNGVQKDGDWYRAKKEQGKVESTTTLDLVKEATAYSHNIAIAAGTWSFSLDPATMKLTCTKAGATPDPTVPVTGITVTPSTLEIVAGNSSKLVATVAPENATDKTVSWTSDDEDVVTVDANGNIVAVEAGVAVVTAACGGFTATCQVTVTPATAESMKIYSLFDADTMDYLAPSLIDFVDLEDEEEGIVYFEGNEATFVVDSWVAETGFIIGVTDLAKGMDDPEGFAMYSAAKELANGVAVELAAGDDAMTLPASATGKKVTFTYNVTANTLKAAWSETTTPEPEHTVAIAGSFNNWNKEAYITEKFVDGNAVFEFAKWEANATFKVVIDGENWWTCNGCEYDGQTYSGVLENGTWYDNMALNVGERNMSLAASANGQAVTITVAFDTAVPHIKASWEAAVEPENPYANWYIGIAYGGNNWPAEGETMREVHPNAEGIATFAPIADLGGYFVVRVWDGTKGTWIIPVEGKADITEADVYVQGQRTEGSDRYNKSFHNAIPVLWNNAVVVADVVNNKVKVVPQEPYFVSVSFVNSKNWPSVKAHIWNSVSNASVDLELKAPAAQVAGYALADGAVYTLNETIGFEPTNLLFFDGSKNLGDGAEQTADLTFSNYTSFDANGSTGIESVIAGQEAPVYFNLQGVQVNNPAAGEVYIVVRGNKVSKELVK